jgi:hypothetical protein
MTIRDLYERFARCGPDYGEHTFLVELDKSVHCYLLGLLRARLPRRKREAVV